MKNIISLTVIILVFASYTKQDIVKAAIKTSKEVRN